MVKIRLRRIGTKGRPFYRVVVAKSTAGRNGAFVETLGQYDPVVKPALININEERALYWLNEGAQPTETTAYLLNKVGILPRFFEARPNAKKQYSFLDKRTASISKPSAVTAVAPAEPAPAPAPEPVAEAPVEEPIAETPVAETPAVEAAAEEVQAEPTVEAPVADSEPEAAPAEA
ncbi:MAG TPA: 30S ribosomal protein S16 [Fimbriimonadaceae bacterium]|nr:30S ribosomal protein S16 [Fimbriimonadaceae bacterium]